MLLIIIMTLLGAVASIFFKKASSNVDILKLLKSKELYIGGAMYLIAAVCNVFALKKFDYSVVLPLTSLTYIWTIFLSWRILGEKISRFKIIGVCCIILGSIVIVV